MAQKTLNEQIAEVMNNAMTTKAEKEISLVKLGLQKYEISLLLNFTPSKSRVKRIRPYQITFGVETKKGISFAHNGILAVKPDGDKTDSETAFRNIVYPCIQQYGFNSDELKLTVGQIIGYSKFALMNEKGDIRLFGDFMAHDGRLYSNLRHLGRYY